MILLATLWRVELFWRQDLDLRIFNSCNLFELLISFTLLQTESPCLHLQNCVRVCIQAARLTVSTSALQQRSLASVMSLIEMPHLIEPLNCERTQTTQSPCVLISLFLYLVFLTFEVLEIKKFVPLIDLESVQWIYEKARDQVPLFSASQC